MKENAWIWIAGAGVALYLWQKSQQQAATQQPVVTQQQPVSVVQPVQSIAPVSVVQQPAAQPISIIKPVSVQTVNPNELASNLAVQQTQAAVPSVPLVINSSGNLVSQWSPNVTNQFNKSAISGYLNDEEGD